MPVKRQLTDEEKQYYESQGYDTSSIPSEGVDVYTPEEIRHQQMVAEAQKAGMGSAALSTLKAHAGSLAGGAALGIPATAAIAPWMAASWAGGPVTGIPATALGLVGIGLAGLGGSTLGKLGQEAIVPKATQQALEEKAAAAREAYPKTSIGTDIAAGALLQGGRPSLAVPGMAAKGLGKAIMSGGSMQFVPKVEQEAMRNVLSMNAANVGVNAGLQYGTTGKIDPLELTGSAIAGGLFSQPNIIGRKLLKWEPLSAEPRRSLQKEPEGFTISDGNIERIGEYQARMKQAESEWQRQQQENASANAYSQQEQARVEAERQQFETQRSEFQQRNWKTIDSNFPQDSKGNINYAISSRIVKKTFTDRNELDIPKGADDTTRAQIKSKNEEMRKTPVEQMRDELYHQDYTTKDPEGYARFQQEQAAKDAAITARNQKIFKSVQEANAKAAADKVRAERHLEWVKAEAERKQEVVQQTQEAARIKAQQEAEAWKQRQESKKGLSENTARILNTKGIAEGMMKGGVEAPQTGAERYQPLDKEGVEMPTKATPELLEQARRNAVTVGQLGAKEPLLITDPSHSQFGQEAKGAQVDPKKIGERLILLSDKATGDSGYHELLHSALMDMDRSGDAYLQQLANKMRRVNAGEEALVQAGGKQYQDHVEGRKKFFQRTGDMLKDVYAGAAARFGSESPGLLRRHLIALSRIEKGAGTPLLEASNRAAGIAPKTGAQYQPLKIGVSNEAGQDNYPIEIGIGQRQEVAKGTDVTQLPSYDKSRHFENGDGGNYWMSKSGQMIPVRGHMPFARDFLDSHGVESHSAHVYDKMFERGFNRVVIEGNGIHVELSPKHPMSAIQVRTLKNFAIENGKEWIHAESMNLNGENTSKMLWERALEENDSGVRYQPVKVEDVLTPQEGRLGKQGYYTINDPRLQASSVHIDDKAIHIINLQVPSEGQSKGVGSDVITKLKALADSEGKPLVLTAHPDSEAQQEALNKFYAKNGFKEGENREFTYIPTANDSSRYSTIQSEIKSTPVEQRLAKMQEHAAEIESIKNRNGGFPPDTSNGIKYQSTTDELAAKDSAHKPFTLPLFRSMLDSVERISPPLAKAMNNFGERFDLLRGQLTEDVIGKLKKFINPLNFKELYTQDNGDMRVVIDRLKDIYYNDESKIKLTPKQQEIDGVVRESYLKSVALKNKYADAFGETTPDPNYIAIMPGRKALETLLNGGVDNPERVQLIKDFYKLHEEKLGESHDEATKKLQTFLNGYDKQKVQLAEQFGPIDKDAGEIVIPRSWSENNLIDVMARFNNRYARRIAYHEAIERNPDVLKLLKDPIEGVKGSEAVKAAMEDISGRMEFIEAKRQAASGLVRAAMLGPLTGAKDFVSNLVLGFQHQTPGQAVASALHSWSNMKENIAESFSAGINRHNIGVMEMGDSLGLGDIVNVMRRSRDVLNTVQGRNFLEQMTRATAYGQGKFLAMDNIKAASKGDLRGQRKQFLDDMAPGWEAYKSSGEFPPEELIAIASRYVRSVQGSYDFRGLPHIAQRGTLAPYLSLARWNIEKTNNFVKYNIEPLRNGNPLPLLMSTIGMFIGGSALTKLVEMATNKKQRTPEWKEIADAKEQGHDVTQAVVWKLSALASLSGYLGMVGDLTKSMMDLQMKNRPQTWDNPLLTGISSVAGNAWDVIEAAQSGDLKLTSDVLGNFLEDTTQVYRLALNNLSSTKKEQLARSDKMRDLRVYNQVSGEDVGETSKDRPNPYMGEDIKRYKQTEDINEAIGLLPGLIKHAFDKAGGDYEKLHTELDKIKHNSYQTMPSLERMPLAFFRYYNSLARTQGDDVARARMVDYVRQNSINSVKSSLVP